jgi:hypothetical protein
MKIIQSVDSGVVDKYSYDELINICKNFNGNPFQVWTKSPC